MQTENEKETNKKKKKAPPKSPSSPGFGVRPLPKRQMILKLKEIHQYTHQLVSSDSEDEAPVSGATAQMKPPASRPVSCAQTVKFKEPRAPADVCPVKHNGDEVAEPLSNPELCISSDGDSDSDGGISASQAASRLQDRLKAVHSFILSDSKLYSQILQYKPLVLSQLQEQLKAAGIRLGAAKLMDYLDSQCITFTTAKPGRQHAQSNPQKKKEKKEKKVNIK
uniref:Structure-specific endonuclease subunit SLX4 n=1 Tax=Neolamprologus brichardi TaxID=32507 RepID=A0A3Q4G4V3_NEOBR